MTEATRPADKNAGFTVVHRQDGLWHYSKLVRDTGSEQGNLDATPLIQISRSVSRLERDAQLTAGSYATVSLDSPVIRVALEMIDSSSSPGRVGKLLFAIAEEKGLFNAAQVEVHQGYKPDTFSACD